MRDYLKATLFIFGLWAGCQDLYPVVRFFGIVVILSFIIYFIKLETNGDQDKETE